MDRVAIRRLVHTQGDVKVPSHRCKYTYVPLQSSATIVFDSSRSRSHRSDGAMEGRASAAQQASVEPILVAVNVGSATGRGVVQEASEVTGGREGFAASGVVRHLAGSRDEAARFRSRCGPLLWVVPVCADTLSPGGEHLTAGIAGATSPPTSPRASAAGGAACRSPARPWSRPTTTLTTQVMLVLLNVA
jgi:hypothetical protein